MKITFTKIIASILLVTIALPPLLIVQATQPTIVITEVGAHASSGYEWIEVFNTTDEVIDMTEWKFYEDSTNHSITAPTSPLIQPHQFAVITQVPEKFIEQHQDFTGIIFDSAWSSLKEDGEEIGLKDAQGEVVELVAYCAVTNASCERSQDLTTWTARTQDDSLGAWNSAPPENSIDEQTQDSQNQNNDTSSQQDVGNQLEDACFLVRELIISEIMIDPVDGDKEWIELFNKSDNAISLERVELHDSVGKIATLAGNIASQSYFVHTLSSSKLNNSGDMVALQCDEEIIDSITYPHHSQRPDEGQV
ncbi:lamin tail domain-containing protein, partial [Candidatus Falkowbacteria bacterium]|nr:lamin tail domain-containing protein [Candidatus Falkowbacteria bacterium]